MLQYATKHEIIEDTGLITRSEADKLFSKYIEDLKARWNDLESPQLVIWVDCKKETDYHTMGVEIDFRDCILENGHFYKIEKEIIV